MEADVAIIGFGPVGAVAACLLGQAGLKVQVIDAVHEVYDKPRAVALDHEIARVLQGIGLADALEACSEPFTDSVYYGADGRIIKRLTMLPEPYPQAWTPSLVFLQPRLEEAVRRRAQSFSGVEIALGSKLTGLRQDAHGVMLDIDGPNGPDTLRARYAIGCDGASSTTRKLLGLTLNDLGFDEPWLVVDVLANERGLAKLPHTSVQYCEPARPTTYVICTGAHRRWEFSLNPGEDSRAMERPEAVWQLLARWITPEDATLWRSAAYRFHALVAGGNWRNGRVFIAGDAAHQQPPFLGQGLCQGIRDVANLSWKLTARLRSGAGEALLDSYGVERTGHVRALTTIIKGIGGLIGERDPVRAAARDERLIAEAGGEIRPAPRQDLMPSLQNGFLASEPSPGRGALFPQPWLDTAKGRRRMDDAKSGGFRLICREPVTPDIESALAALGGAPLHVSCGASGEEQDVDGIVEQWLARHDVSYALLRPDHYVFGTAASASTAAALVTEARSQLQKQ